MTCLPCNAMAGYLLNGFDTVLLSLCSRQTAKPCVSIILCGVTLLCLFSLSHCERLPVCMLLTAYNDIFMEILKSHNRLPILYCVMPGVETMLCYDSINNLVLDLITFSFWIKIIFCNNNVCENSLHEEELKREHRYYCLTLTVNWLEEDEK